MIRDPFNVCDRCYRVHAPPATTCQECGSAVERPALRFTDEILQAQEIVRQLVAPITDLARKANGRLARFLDWIAARPPTA